MIIVVGKMIIVIGILMKNDDSNRNTNCNLDEIYINKITYIQ